MPKKNGQRERAVLAVLADDLAGNANSIDEGRCPTTPEQSHATSSCPSETPRIVDVISSAVSNYLTKIIDARGIERNIARENRPRAKNRVRWWGTQTLHTAPVYPYER